MGANRVRIIALAVAAVAMLSAACSKHDRDLPTKVQFTTPPAVTNLTITTQDNIIFDLSWSTDSPSAVAYYTIYTVDPFEPAPVFQDTTTTTAVTVNTAGFPLPGLVFGVATVTDENVEGAISFAQAEPAAP